MGHIKIISIAETDKDREEGLMFRNYIPKMSGMVFKFDSPRILNFWMKNTYIPLDIAFIDNANTIIKIEKMIPFSTRTISSEKPCTIAIETFSGDMDIAGAKIGKKININLKDRIVEIND